MIIESTDNDDSELQRQFTVSLSLILPMMWYRIRVVDGKSQCFLFVVDV